MVGQTGLEPVTPRLSSACSNQLSYRPVLISDPGPGVRNPTAGGDNRIRTGDLLLAKQTLYQLSYAPFWPGHAFRARGRMAGMYAAGRPGRAVMVRL